AAGLQSTDNKNERPATILHVVIAARARRPQFSSRRIFEIGRHNSDDGRRLIIERQLSSNQVAITAKVGLPPFVAHDHDRAGARLIFFGYERAAQDRLRPECLKESW